METGATCSKSSQFRGPQYDAKQHANRVIYRCKFDNCKAGLSVKKSMEDSLVAKRTLTSCLQFSAF